MKRLLFILIIFSILIGKTFADERIKTERIRLSCPAAFFTVPAKGKKHAGIRRICETYRIS